MSETPPATWKEFFDSHAPHYHQNPFTLATRQEVDFIVELFALQPGHTILDMGCGTGRHAVELAKRGMHVTGVDQSSGMLAEARKAAESAGVQILDQAPWEEPSVPPGSVYFHEGDATKTVIDFLYDGVICLCEGGMGLANPDEDPIAHDVNILKNCARALRPNGMFLLTALNGYATIRQMTDEQVEQGVFDPATMLSQYENEWELPEGKRILRIRERLFIPPEMVAMLRFVGLQVEHVWGGTAGEWGRRPIKLDEVEAMYVCRKP
jgi:SAM-dependent methyltransferase